MKMILKRDIYFIFSKKNYLFFILLMLIASIPIIFPYIKADDYLITIFGMNLELVDKRYFMWLFIIQFYFLWLANTLFWNDLRYSYEFIWLRMNPEKWYIYKLVSLLIVFILLDLFISLGFMIYSKIIGVDASFYLITIIVTSIIQFSLSVIVITGTCYYPKSTIYITVFIYVLATIFKVPGLLIIFTPTVTKNIYLILLVIPIVIISYYLVSKKILKLTEGRFIND